MGSLARNSAAEGLSIISNYSGHGSRKQVARYLEKGLVHNSFTVDQTVVVEQACDIDPTCHRPPLLCQSMLPRSPCMR